jgi:hypothetical protein
MQFEVGNHSTRVLVSDVFRELPLKVRRGVEAKLAAVTDTELVTAVRPFMFGGRVVRELYFDPSKLLFFNKREKIGAVMSAFIISYLAQRYDVPLSDQTLRTHHSLILRYAKRLRCRVEVSAFLRRTFELEDEWILSEHNQKADR